MIDNSSSPENHLVVDQQHPYLGLQYYREENKEFFFGRTNDTQQLLYLVQRNLATVLSGKSGLGKTSLIKAGLMPKLRELDYYPVYLRLNFDNPELSVLDHLKDSICQQLVHIDKSLPAFGVMSLWEYFHRYRVLNGFTVPVLIFDQFEELFTRGQYDSPDVIKLKTELFDLVENQIPELFQEARTTKELPFDIKAQDYRIIFSLREDYLADLESLAAYMPALKKSRYRIVQMTESQALEAIYCPGKAVISEENSARILGLIYHTQLESSGLAGRRAEKEIEPFLLSLICFNINELRISRNEQEITAETLRAVRVRNIIEDFYVQSVGALSKKGQHQLESGLLTADGFRKLLPKSDLVKAGSISNRDIDYLIDKRILRKEIWSGREHVELIHDILIPVVKERIRAREGERLMRRRLGYAASILVLLVFLVSFVWWIHAMNLNAELRRLNDTLLASQQQVIKERDDANNEKQEALGQTIRALKERANAEEQSRVARDEREKANRQKDIADSQRMLAEERLTIITNAQIQERSRTVMKLEELASLSDDESWRAEPIISNVATYLWLKDDKASIDTLERMLKKYEKYIPYTYGLDNSFDNMVDVSDSTDWPLTLSYNPDISIYWDVFEYYWKIFSDDFTSAWGIPLPAQVKLIADRNLQLTQMKISAPGKKDLFFTVPDPRGKILVTRSGVENNRQLLEFFESHEDEWQEIETLKEGGPWYLAPKWTQPIIRAGDYASYPGEAVEPLLFAYQLFEHPDMVLNDDVLKLLFGRVCRLYPTTMEEAMKNRGDFEGLKQDASALISEGTPLLYLDQVLANLADYRGYTSGEASNYAAYACNTNQLVSVSVRGSGKNADDDLDTMMFKGSFSRYTRESKYIQTFPAYRVRIFIGSGMAPYFIEKNNDLSTGLLMANARVRADLFRRYGVELPSVKYYDESATLTGYKIRIEVLNQNKENSDATEISLDPDNWQESYYRELFNRGATYRILWITPEIAENYLESLPSEVSSWLKNYYTVTDIKNILKSVIAPGDSEIKAYAAGEDGRAIRLIPPENTVYHADWLLKSLLFWLQTDIDRDDISQVSDALVRTQKARFSATQSAETGSAVYPVIKEGIENLMSGRIQSSISDFREALRKDYNGAIESFLMCYPGYCSIGIKPVLQDSVTPGWIERTNRLSNNELRDVELYLDENRKMIGRDDHLNFLFILAYNYMELGFREKADSVIGVLARIPDKEQWSASQKYLAGYFFLKNNKSDPYNPIRVTMINTLLKEAVSVWPESSLERIFREVQTLIRNDFDKAPWSNRLLMTLADQRPESYWVNYFTANQLSQQPLYDFLQSSLRYADKAALSAPVKNRDRYLSWLDLEKGKAYSGLAFFVEKPEWQSFKEKGTAILESLNNNPEINDDGWPGYENIIFPLYSIYVEYGETDKAENLVKEWQKKYPDGVSLYRLDYFNYLIKGDMSRMLLAAGKISKEMPDNLESVFADILTNDPGSDYVCKTYISTYHDNNDWFRLWLCYYLMMNGRTDEATAVLNNRWKEIDRSKWERRLENGDVYVLGEMWIGVFLGLIDEREVTGFYESRETFEKSPFAGKSYMEGVCDVFFYRALFYATRGNMKEYRLSLERVLSSDMRSYYEYQIARHLAGETKKKDSL